MERCLGALDYMTQCIAPNPSRFTTYPLPNPNPTSHPQPPPVTNLFRRSYNYLCSTYSDPLPRVVTHEGQPILAASRLPTGRAQPQGAYAPYSWGPPSPG